GQEKEFSEAVRADLERASVRETISKKTLAHRVAPKLHMTVAHVHNMLAGQPMPTNVANRRRLFEAVTEQLEIIFEEEGVDEPVTDYAARFLDDDQGTLFEPSATTTFPSREIFRERRQQLTASSYSSASMDDWQAAFWDVYGLQDTNLKLHDMMLQLTVDATRLSEAIRKENYVEALGFLPRVMSWVFSLSSTTVGSFPDLSPHGALLSEVIWHKYPGLCSLCAEPRCICVTWVTDDLSEEERLEKQEANAERLAEARRTGRRPRSFDEWVDMFEQIYGRVNRSRRASEKMLHLWEEIGELEVELRNADRVASGDLARTKPIDWEAELADVFSWVSSTYLHIVGYLLRAKAVDDAIESKARMDDYTASRYPDPPKLSTWIWLEFQGDKVRGGLRCHKCGDAVCTCPLNYERR
ncbi:MAG TPA: hypothetical protein VF230_13290, partial [Acidimicrobiales bacterium]